MISHASTNVHFNFFFGLWEIEGIAKNLLHLKLRKFRIGFGQNFVTGFGNFRKCL